MERSHRSSGSLPQVDYPPSPNREGFFMRPLLLYVRYPSLESPRIPHTGTPSTTLP